MFLCSRWQIIDLVTLSTTMAVLQWQQSSSGTTSRYDYGAVFNVEILAKTGTELPNLQRRELSEFKTENPRSQNYLFVDRGSGASSILYNNYCKPLIVCKPLMFAVFATGVIFANINGREIREKIWRMNGCTVVCWFKSRHGNNRKH